MRPSGSTEALWRRRMRAVRLVKEQGLTLTQAGHRVGAHRNSVGLWVKAFDAGGEEALRCKQPGGSSCRLTDDQLDDLVVMLLQGPKAHGFDTEMWTTPRIAELIQRHFGVSYHRDHVGRLMRRLNFSCQKPAKVPNERDEYGIGAWLERQWPRIKKK